jgi:uncharacterized protein (TIGR02996 family)
MTDRESLLSAVLDQPADDTARLVLADFLREQTDPADMALGRFVWAGVTASRYWAVGAVADDDLDAAFAELSAVVADWWPARWLAALGLGPTPLTAGDWGCETIDDRVTVLLGATTGEFERGMLAGLTVTLDQWYDAAARALAAWPVERVTVSDAPVLAFWVSADAARPGWCLSVALTGPTHPPPPRRVLLPPVRLPGPRLPVPAGSAAVGDRGAVRGPERARRWSGRGVSRVGRAGEGGGHRVVARPTPDPVVSRCRPPAGAVELCWRLRRVRGYCVAHPFRG